MIQQQQIQFDNLEELNSSTQISLHLQEKRIDENGIQNLIFALAQCLKCSTLNLNLHDNLISNKGASKLGQGLSAISNLQNLNIKLSLNRICNKGVSDFAQALANCSKLSTLNLNLKSNSIGAQGALDLALGLSKCNNLSNLTLHFQDNYIGSQGAQNLALALSKCTNISNLTLLLNNNGIGQGSDDFGNYFGNFQGIQALILNLSGNQIDDNRVLQLATGLVKCNNLLQCSLYLNQNKISKKIAFALMDMLGNCSISNLILHLNEQKIVENSVFESAPSLKKPSNLTKLRLSLKQNNIDQQDGFQLASSIAKFTNLTNLELNLRENGTQTKCAQNLIDGLQKCINIQSLKLFLHLYHEDADFIKKIYLALTEFSYLTSLHFNISNYYGTISNEQFNKILLRKMKRLVIYQWKN